MEIEVKARLKNEKVVVKKLTELGCKLSEPIVQDDTVWSKEAGSLKVFLSNDVFLRIRIQNREKIILTAKKPKAKSGHASLVKHEFEVVVDSEKEAQGILTLLGLQPAVHTKKIRRKTNYKDYEICIDEIENLGAFIEIEKIGEEKDANKIQKEMLLFLSSLSVSEDDVVKKGYDILMLEKEIKHF